MSFSKTNSASFLRPTNLGPKVLLFVLPMSPSQTEQVAELTSICSADLILSVPLMAHGTRLRYEMTCERFASSSTAKDSLTT